MITRMIAVHGSKLESQSLLQSSILKPLFNRMKEYVSVNWIQNHLTMKADKCRVASILA